jgi:hypothetical protein
MKCKKLAIIAAASLVAWATPVFEVSAEPSANSTNSQVNSASTIDNVGPVVSEPTVNPKWVDISSTAQLVTLTVEVTDESGVRGIPSPYFYHYSDVQGTKIIGSFQLISGNSRSGTYRAEVTIPTSARLGDWHAGFIAFSDVNGYNSTNGGYGTEFKVANGPYVAPTTTTTTTTTLPMVTTSNPPPTYYVAPPSAATIVAKPILTTKKALSAKSIATHTGLKVVTGSKVSMTVYATSRKTCRVSGTTLKAVKKGTCRVTVTVKSRTGKKSSSNLTLDVRS